MPTEPATSTHGEINEPEKDTVLSRRSPSSKGASFKSLKRGKSKRERRKNYFNIRSRRELKRRRTKKTRGKKEGRILTPINSNHFKSMSAPVDFSLVGNTDLVLGYFKEVSQHISERVQIEFDLSKIENLTPDAIALLVAKVNDLNFTRGLTVQGNKPEKQELKRIFEESGFLDHVKSAYKPPRNTNNLLIHQVSHKKVIPVIAREVGIRSVKHTFRNRTKFQPIYKIMIECMANTDNHASLNKEGFYNWWLFTYCDPNSRITSFTFLDLGIGIFNSRPVNDYKRKFLTNIENFTKLPLASMGNLDLVPSLFSGEIYTSRTGEKERGQGLPTIKELSENPHIKNFTIITNNVRMKLPSLDSQILNSKLNGTLLYWELHP